MDNEMRNYLKQYGRVQSDEKTWVHPWVTYWRVFGFDHETYVRLDDIIKHLSERYPAYAFGKGETIICNIIYPTIIINKK